MTDPLYERAMDLLGRISHLCLKLDTTTAPAELLSHPLASSHSINCTQALIKDVNSINLQAFLKEKDNESLVTDATLAAIPSTPTIWFAVATDRTEDVEKKAVVNQIVRYLQQRPMECTRPRVSKDEPNWLHRRELLGGRFVLTSYVQILS